MVFWNEDVVFYIILKCEYESRTFADRKRWAAGFRWDVAVDSAAVNDEFPVQIRVIRGNGNPQAAGNSPQNVFGLDVVKFRNFSPWLALLFNPKPAIGIPSDILNQGVLKRVQDDIAQLSSEFAYCPSIMFGSWVFIYLDHRKPLRL